MGILSKKAAPDKVDRLFAAARELTEAWADMPRGVSPWIDWKNRRVIIQVRDYRADNQSPASLRDHLIANGDVTLRED